MKRSREFIEYFNRALEREEIGQEEYNVRETQYRKIKANESKSILNGMAINVNDGEAIISNSTKLQSSGFKNCNCFVLKNLDTQEALMMHVHYHNDPEKGPKPYGIPGISGSICAPLNTFLQSKGRKVGVSLYKPYYYDSHQLGKGAQNDYGATKWLEQQGVKMKRHALPYFQLSNSKNIINKSDMDPRTFQHFDVIYDPVSNILDIEVINPEVDENKPYINIAHLKPFDHCIQSVRSENTAAKNR